MADGGGRKTRAPEDVSVSVRYVTTTRRGKTESYWLVDVVYRYPDGKTQRVKRRPRVQNKRGAEQYERELLASLADGTFDKKPEPNPEEKRPVLFKDFAKRFLETYVATNNKHSEATTKESVFKHHLVPAFGELTLDQITEERIEKYKGTKLRRKRPLSAKTINNQLTILRKTLSIAVKWKELAHVPEIQWLKTQEPEIEFFGFEEADRLIGSAAPEWRTMIIVAVRTGLRIGELIGLRWEDVDLHTGQLHVRQAVALDRIGTPKSGKSRKLPLSREALDALKAHRHLRGELVFCADDGRMLRRNQCRRPLWAACRRAGLRRIGWHVLRHTFASHLAIRGASLQVIQQLLGHATLEMTLRYAHLTPAAHQEAISLLDGPWVGKAHGRPAGSQTEKG